MLKLKFWGPINAKIKIYLTMLICAFFNNENEKQKKKTLFLNLKKNHPVFK
jgi:hypothetical protein